MIYERETAVRRFAVIAAAVAVLCVIVFLISLLFRGGNMESAIDAYDDERYQSSLVALKKLAATEDYESGEKVLYYRCKAVNALAAELEADYADELKLLGGENRDVNPAAREKAGKKLERKLKKINERTGADLDVFPDAKRARILPRGRFYEEFLSRYKGSRYIEDLDFDGIRSLMRTEPDKLLNAIGNFYMKYPNTFYLSSIVKMIFESMRGGAVSADGKEELVKGIIMAYGAKYPTSSEIQRIYLCSGNDVNLRNSPGTDGEIVGKVKADEILIQLEKSMDTFQIGDVRDYWYRVATPAGLRGWIFGKFLRPLDVAALAAAAPSQAWTVDDHFTEWDDSNTPKNWLHTANAEKSSISFSQHGDAKIIKLNCPRGRTAGLFRRFDSGNAFTIKARARFIAGGSFVLFACCLNPGLVYYLQLRDEEIDLSGRRIPLHTSDWHEYTLESDDGRQAKLMVDGEVILSRIPPVNDARFSARGIYCLYSPDDEASLGEMEYLKTR